MMMMMMMMECVLVLVGPSGLGKGKEAQEDIRGKETVPVISLEGAIGVLL